MASEVFRSRFSSPTRADVASHIRGFISLQLSNKCIYDFVMGHRMKALCVGYVCIMGNKIIQCSTVCIV